MKQTDMQRRSFDKQGNRIRYDWEKPVDYVGPDGRVVRIVARMESEKKKYAIDKGNGVPSESIVMKKTFASARLAALAAWKAGGSAYHL